MRTIVAAALMAVGIMAAGAQTPALIAPDEAAKHVGETVRVQGIVTQVKITAKDSTTLIDFGPAFPHQVLTAVIHPADRKTFPGVETLTGKLVIVAGKVTLYKGKPEIVLTKPLQLQVVT
jgi:DNA/RNA endonuclease YhcR with UshA esterase domain